MKKRDIIILCSIIAIAVCAIRIYRVNHQEWIEKHKATEIVYEEKERISLPNAFYFIYGEKDLSGYYVQIVNTELLEMQTFLSEYEMTLEDLVSISNSGSIDDYKKCGYVYVVTARFNNERWKEVEQQGSISLDDFVLVGSDYWEFARTKDINLIPEFNPELSGASNFGIGSDRIVEIKLPYLIEGNSLNDTYVKHVLEDSPKLLISSYPEVVYLKLPYPEIIQGAERSGTDEQYR